MRERGTRLGCLATLALWAILGIFTQHFGEWGRRGAADEGGGGRFAAVGILGVIGYVSVFGIIAFVRWLLSVGRNSRRGFPVIPPHDGEV